MSTATWAPPRWHTSIRVVAGGLCACHGLCLLVTLPSAGITAGLASGDWVSWWAAVIQFDGGLVLATGTLTGPAAWACAAALAVTTIGAQPQPGVVPTPGASAFAMTLVSLVLVRLAAYRVAPSGSGMRRGPVAAIATVVVLAAPVALTPPVSQPEHHPMLAALDIAGPSPAPGVWATRPRVRLDYQLADDLASVTGRESGTVTPDLPTCELVFRAWPNNPTISATGGSLSVSAAVVDGRRIQPQSVPAGGASTAAPTLLRLTLPHCVNPGQPVAFSLDFQVALGAGADERLGHSRATHTAWFGSAYPMLSWVRGQGWATDPAVAMNGETATSEDTVVTLSVTAPQGLAVQGVGTPTHTTPGPTAATTTHWFFAPAVRDVSVAVGDYHVVTQHIGEVTVHLAIPATGSKATPSQWVQQLSHAMTGESKLFGPFPYQDFWVSLTPGQSDGTEFPGALQFSDAEPSQLVALVAHEVAHQWFYALVGNNQARDPWLDEGLATYGEAMVGGDAEDYAWPDIPERVVGLMGQPMRYWVDHGGFDRYTEGVYNQGAATLLTARQRVGGQAFDQALRAYVAANAYRVATPAEFAAAFRELPEVIALLRKAGCWSASD